jgi:nitrite reductase/ring-hydroxylating ferredoxin subunit
MGEAGTRRRVLVGTRAELTDGTQRIVRLDDELYSYENRCSHQGGPVCEGTVIGLVQARLGSHGEMLGERFSDSEPHLVCPWHGVEFRLLTGECVTIPGARLRARQLELDEAGCVYLVLDGAGAAGDGAGL